MQPSYARNSLSLLLSPSPFEAIRRLCSAVPSRSPLPVYVESCNMSFPACRLSKANLRSKATLRQSLHSFPQPGASSDGFIAQGARGLPQRSNCKCIQTGFWFEDGRPGQVLVFKPLSREWGLVALPGPCWSARASPSHKAM